MMTYAVRYLKLGLVLRRGLIPSGVLRRPMDMPANNKLERSEIHSGRLALAMDCALGEAQQQRWSAAQQDR